MSDNIVLFNKVIKCDLCGWEGTTAAMGPHVIHSHLQEIDKRIMNVIEKNGSSGTTVENVSYETGFPADRVRGRFRTFARLGKIGLVRRKNHYTAFPVDAAVEFPNLSEGTARCSSCKKVRLTTYFPYRDRKKGLRRTECKSCTYAPKNIEKAEAAAVKQTEQNEQNDTFDTLMSQIYRKADEMLKEKYKDEYDSLVGSRVQNMFTNLIEFKTNK